MKAILMIDTNAWLQQVVIRELQDICDVEVMDMQLSACKPQPSAFSLQPSACKPQPSACKPQPPSPNLQPSAFSLQPIESDILICWKATRELINSIKGLRLIQVWGAGIDQIDMKAAMRRNISVCNTKGAMTNAVAEYVLMQVLIWERDLLYWNKIAHSGQWNWETRNSNLFVELNERSLGVIGLGAIGTEVVKKAVALGLSVRAITKNPSLVEKELRDKLCFLGGLEEMGEVVTNVNYLSMHLPLTQDTWHLVHSRWLEQMKPNSVLINTSRGGIINEHHLAKALRNKRIRGASLDVLTHEPIRPDNPLKKLENVILTCHQAGYTTQAIKNTLDMIRTNIRAIKEGDEKLLINRIS